MANYISLDRICLTSMNDFADFDIGVKKNDTILVFSSRV